MVKESDVGEIVVGLPKNMDGTEGARAELCREFAQKLEEATGLTVKMWDERRTTVEAHNILSQAGAHIVGINAVDQQFAAADVFQTGDHAKRSGFAAARGANKHDEFALFDLKVQENQ